MNFWKTLKITRIALILSPIVFMASKCSEGKMKNLYTIETSYGNIIVQLYDETPGHRDNFIKLVNEGFYDSLLFHRVMPEFMVQGGDPDSKNAQPGVQLGNGGPGYTIPAEFVDTLFHKRGALAAARQGDDVNPNKESSGSQFYIVQGKQFSKKELNQFQTFKTRSLQQQAQQNYMSDSASVWIREGYRRAVEAKNNDSIAHYQQLFQNGLMEAVNSVDSVVFTQQQIDAYTTIGGAPHLDGGYTVFGQVVEGLNIIDSIAMVPRDRANRPLENVVFSIKPTK